MKTKLRLNLCAGDGVGIERSFDFCDTWRQVGYINTGATNSTVNLAEEIVKAVNCHYELLEALETVMRLSGDYVEEHPVIAKVVNAAIAKAKGK